MASHEARFFYHSFPRRARDASRELAVGLTILARIRHYGLLLTPEEIEWKNEHADGSTPRVERTLQRRACFTELAPHELPGHATQFGHFALEFEIETLRRWGAVPVFYIPRPGTLGPTSLEILAQSLLILLLDARNVAQRLVGLNHVLSQNPVKNLPFTVQYPKNPSINKTFNIDTDAAKGIMAMLTHGVTPPNLLYNGLGGLLNFFYPVDDMRYGEPLAYYRQREWRIIGGVSYKGTPVTQKLTDHDRSELLGIDSAFFNRTFKSGERAIDQCELFPGFDGVSVIQSARRIIVPRASIAEVDELLKGVYPRPPVVAIEDI